MLMLPILCYLQVAFSVPFRRALYRDKACPGHLLRALYVIVQGMPVRLLPQHTW